VLAPCVAYGSWSAWRVARVLRLPSSPRHKVGENSSCVSSVCLWLAAAVLSLLHTCVAYMLIVHMAAAACASCCWSFVYNSNRQLGAVNCPPVLCQCGVLLLTGGGALICAVFCNRVSDRYLHVLQPSTQTECPRNTWIR
jgi:hypothetical protein